VSTTSPPSAPERERPLETAGAVAVVDERLSPRELLREAWVARGLIPRLGFRVTIKGFAGTKLGRAWLVVRPLLNVFGMALVFGAVLDTPSQGLPYLVFLLTGVHIWMSFERCAFWGVRSFDIYRRPNRALRFPILLLPLAAVMPALLEFAVIGTFAACTLLFYVLTEGQLYLDVRPALLLVVPAYLMAAVSAVSIVLWLAPLNAHARDVRIVFVYVLRIWVYLTPVIYPLAVLPAGLDLLARFNPVTAPVELARWSLFGVGEVPLGSLAVTLAWILVVGGGGLFFLAWQAPFLRRSQNVVDDEEEEV